MSTNMFMLEFLVLVSCSVECRIHVAKRICLTRRVATPQILGGKFATADLFNPNKSLQNHYLYWFDAIAIMWLGN